MSQEVDSKILARLDEWQQKGALPHPIDLYARLMRAQTQEKLRIHIVAPRLGREVILERLSSGKPALSFDEMQLDWSRVQQLFEEALVIISEYVPAEYSVSSFPLRQMARAWYDGEQLLVLNGESDALSTAIHTALRPYLAAYAEALLPQIEQKSWRRGYCPICGGKPAFAFLDQSQGTRWLICPRCDAQWMYQRMECPFCSSRDQGKLSYYSDDQGLYRLYVCEQCKGYIKAIDLRKSQSEVLLPLQWIITLDMDRQACDLGYGFGDLTKIENTNVDR